MASCHGSLVLWAVAAAILAGQSHAQVVPAESPSWIDDRTHPPRPKLADIAIPRLAGPLRLKSLGDFGSARDANAQYVSQDGQIEATVYIYENGAPDAFLAKIATGRIVASRFGSALRAGPETLVALANRKDAAFRDVLTGGSLQAGSNLKGSVSTASAFAQTQFSVIKIRVTGPQDRQNDILAGLDAILAGLRFTGKAQPLPVHGTTPTVCSEEDDGDIAVSTDEPLSATAVTGAGMELLGGEPQAANGLGDRPCMITSPTSPNIVLRRSKLKDGMRIVMLGDSGTTATIRPVPSLDRSGRPFLFIYSTRGASLFGPFDHIPATSQLLLLGKASSSWLGSPVAQTKFDTGGNFETNINTARMAK